MMLAFVWTGFDWTEFNRDNIPISVYDSDTVTGLDQLSIPVPATWDIAWVNLALQLDRLTQQHCYILQVLVHLQWFHWLNSMRDKNRIVIIINKDPLKSMKTANRN